MTFNENPGEGHQVTRKVVIRHRVVNIEQHDNDLIDWGEPMSPENFKVLQDFADSYFQALLQSTDIEQLSTPEEIVRAIAKRIETDFPFVEQGTGIATLSKQLETYKSLIGQDKKLIAENSDCKLATALFLMTCEKLKEKLKLQKTSILVQKHGSHPHALVRTSDGISYLVDFRLKRPEKESDRATESKVDVTPYDENQEFYKKALDKVLGMNQELEFSQQGLNRLDQNFIDS